MDPQEMVLIARARHLAASGRGEQVRRAANLSLSEVGRAIGVATSTVLRWESGDRVPRGAQAAAWATLINSLERAGVKAS